MNFETIKRIRPYLFAGGLLGVIITFWGGFPSLALAALNSTCNATDSSANCTQTNVTTEIIYSSEALNYYTCDETAAEQCYEDYGYCLRTTGPAADVPTACACAQALYGVCLRAAGCAADSMMACLNELIELDCDDITVCGNNCASDGLITEDEIVLPVNNFGSNYLRFTLCDKGIDQHQRSAFGRVAPDACWDAADRTACPYWVPPRTFTALAVPPNTTNLRLQYCVLGAGTGGSTKCLEDPAPETYYGTAQHWPGALTTAPAPSFYCADDEDCPGSVCDTQQSPPFCAEKRAHHFTGSASNYYDDTFGDGQDLTHDHADL
mmetsp:Transcript_44040/g.71905  ORF Transcript_44040/g.71905 Transcript_44040/m.71905 type:complete len:322 (-) Transcript_44040:742-1707(-)